MLTDLESPRTCRYAPIRRSVQFFVAISYDTSRGFETRITLITSCSLSNLTHSISQWEKMACVLKQISVISWDKGELIKVFFGLGCWLVNILVHGGSEMLCFLPSIEHKFGWKWYTTSCSTTGDSVEPKTSSGSFQSKMNLDENYVV